MGDMTISNIPDAVLKRLRDRASQEQKSAETLVLELLERAALMPRIPSRESLSELDRIRAMTPAPLPSSVPLIRELREQNDTGR